MADLQKQLTSDIAIRLATGWRELLTDKALATVVGIDIEVLRQWLDKNEQVVIVRTFLVKDADGEDKKEYREETIGLADLKLKELQRLEYEYLTKHSRLIDEISEGKNRDVKTAIKAIQWRLEKAMPEKYGKDGSSNNITFLNLPEIG